MKQALIIFVRNPELGKVKTRLAATMGNEKALEIYKGLLLHTKSIAELVQAHKFIYYHQHTVADDIWSSDVFIKKLQPDANLGKKMSSAFNELFDLGYEQVIIIGSDCLQLNTGIINDAFALLQLKDLVIGPANDGGYYLLGMNHMLDFIFENKTWSTDTVFGKTLQDAVHHHLSVGLLPELIDVDTEEDWLASKSMQL